MKKATPGLPPIGLVSIRQHGWLSLLPTLTLALFPLPALPSLAGYPAFPSGSCDGLVDICGHLYALSLPISLTAALVCGRMRLSGATNVVGSRIVLIMFLAVEERPADRQARAVARTCPFFTLTTLVRGCQE
jgi:hypothetical protein